jgi:CRISPR-associated DxTHG motif protein
MVRGNVGWVTEASGTATIASGATSVVVTHGLNFTPTLADISITLGENPTNDPGNVWPGTFTATQFTVNCRNDPGASNLDLAWQAMRL